MNNWKSSLPFSIRNYRRPSTSLRATISILSLVALISIGVPARMDSSPSQQQDDLLTAQAVINRIEHAATPKPFASISLLFRPRPVNFILQGQLLLNPSSDGFDLTRDRLVIALGSKLFVVESGSFQNPGNGRAWLYINPDRTDPLIRTILLVRLTDRNWLFNITGPTLPSNNPIVYMRAGNDWGGINFNTNRPLLKLEPVLDLSNQAQGVIGPDGGTIQTTDASGVVIRLEVPVGALGEPTLIKVTPLAASPLPDSSKALHPGVKFEPEGLQFTTPATLTLDFSASGKEITNKHFVFLLTSPLTTLPLLGDVNPATKTLTALVPHFSEVGGGEAEQAYLDLRAWADSVLSSGQNLSLSELQSLLQLSVLQQQIGCTTNCIDLGQIASVAGDSIAALVAAICPASGASTASDAALAQLVQLETLAQQLGTSAPSIRPCMETVLRILIERDGDLAIANPSDANRMRLLTLIQRAQGLGFATLETLGLQKLDQAMRAFAAQVLARFEAARGTPGEQAARQQARTELEGALLFVTTTAADVLRVAPTLADDLQGAINSLDGGNISVMILAGTRVRSFVPPCEEGINCEVVADAGSNATLPLTLSVPGLTLRVTQTAPNVVAVDADATTGASTPDNLHLNMRITLNQPGSLTITSNFEQWRTSTPGGCFSAGSIQEDPSNPNVLTVSIDLNFCNAASSLNGSGRLVTITARP